MDTDKVRVIRLHDVIEFCSVRDLNVWDSGLQENLVTDATMANNTTVIDDNDTRGECSLNPDIGGIGVSISTLSSHARLTVGAMIAGSHLVPCGRFHNNDSVDCRSVAGLQIGQRPSTLVPSFL